VRRREFIQRTSLAAAGMAIGRGVFARQSDDAREWREYEVITHVEVLRPAGRTRVWLPMPLAETDYQRTLGDTYRAENGFVEMYERPGESLDMLVAEWADGVAPILKVSSRVATRDRVLDLTRPMVPPPDSLSAFAPFLRGTRSTPIDGIVKTTADEITRDAGTDLERARAIYDWVVTSAHCDPTAPGCGAADIRSMLESGNPAATCASANRLFVALARAAGIPARVVYGLRVGRSRTVRRLGLVSDDATRAQHDRAEVYLAGFGWVPVDPADVRNVMLDDPAGNLPLTDARIAAARAQLFGSWEMNWIAFNYASDVSLPGARRGLVACFMYPQAETANTRIDGLDADGFRYDISARVVS
jgi:transglutaminase-like putative cysteine protease